AGPGARRRAAGGRREPVLAAGLRVDPRGGRQQLAVAVGDLATCGQRLLTRGFLGIAAGEPGPVMIVAARHGGGLAGGAAAEADAASPVARAVAQRRGARPRLRADLRQSRREDDARARIEDVPAAGAAHLPARALALGGP